MRQGKGALAQGARGSGDGSDGTGVSGDVGLQPGKRLGPVSGVCGGSAAGIVN